MDIKQNTAATVRLVPSAPMSAPMATIYTDQRVSVATPVATPSSVDTTVSTDAANSSEAFALSSAAGVVPGLSVIVSDPQWGTSVAMVSAIEGTRVRLVEPLPGIPAAGSTVVGLDVEVTIPATATGTLGAAFVLEVMDGDEHVHMVFAVVVYPFAGPCTARHVRARVARGYPAEYRVDEVFHRQVADDVNELIRGYLLAADRYVSSYWSPSALNPVLLPALKHVLAEGYGLRDSTSTPEDYVRAVESAIGRVIRSAHTIDPGRDGIIQPDEKRRMFTVRLSQ